MSNAFAPNRSYLCAERASHLTVKTYRLRSCRGHIGRPSPRTLRLKRGDHLAKARAICPNSVAEDDARLGLRGCVHSRTSSATAIVKISLAPMVDRRPGRRLGESRQFCYL